MAGMLQSVVLQMAVKINAIAANGNASGSTVKDATPNPCPALPIARPRVTGSVIPNPVKIRLPYVPPNIPLNTIALCLRRKGGEIKNETKEKEKDINHMC